MRSDETAGLVEWYDKLSGGYDELYAREQSVKYDAVLQMVGPRRFEVSVDVACGTGLFLDRLGKSCGLVVGVDVSRNMLERAKTRVSGGNVCLVRADCAWLPLKDEVADCVFAISLLKVGSVLKRHWSEMARVVKSQGFVAGTVFRDGRSRDKLGPLDGAKFRDLSSRESLFLIGRAML